MDDRDEPPAREVIASLIEACGPIRLDRFMALASAHYYATRDPFGHAGDFVTAPEATQAFGEVLGAWCVAAWRGLGAPPRLVLAEAGPGRGTLMADALRLIDRVAPDFAAAAELHLIETSPMLRRVQAARLGHRVAAWHGSLAGLPGGPLLLLANEFLDALPVRQFRFSAGAWVERAVTIEAGRFAWAEIASEPPEDGALERSEAARAWMAEASRRLREGGGVVLVIDYGHEGGATDTLQAVRGHRPADPLADPGEADLTAHVDFAALAASARNAGAAAHGPLPQGEFLRRLGLPERTAVLCRAASPAVARQLQSALRRLTDPDAMGLLCRALAVTPEGAPVPPGFAP